MEKVTGRSRGRERPSGVDAVTLREWWPLSPRLWLAIQLVISCWSFVGYDTVLTVSWSNSWLYMVILGHFGSFSWLEVGQMIDYPTKKLDI